MLGRVARSSPAVGGLAVFVRGSWPDTANPASWFARHPQAMQRARPEVKFLPCPSAGLTVPPGSMRTPEGRDGLKPAVQPVPATRNGLHCGSGGARQIQAPDRGRRKRQRRTCTHILQIFRSVLPPAARGCADGNTSRAGSRSLPKALIPRLRDEGSQSRSESVVVFRSNDVRQCSRQSLRQRTGTRAAPYSSVGLRFVEQAPRYTAGPAIAGSS